ncbi:MAG: PAS domain S-box protein, partial [Microcoleaceae cyanobacterium]
MNEVDILPPGKILVVDDNPAVADLIISLLLDNNYEVKAAKNGKEAINIAESMQPDLILLDINLPDIDGHAVCQKLKFCPGTKKIPIIFISGAYNISDKLQGLREGAVAYLKKPFNPQEALLIIENQITNQRLKQQLEAQNQQLEREISMRRAVEERLRLLERAIAASKNGVILTDARAYDHPIIYVNSGFEKLTGYQASEVIGKNSRFLQGHNIRQSEKTKIKQALATNTECEVILPNYRKDETLFWNKLNISPVNDEQGKVTHFIGIITDISAQIATEATLRERETIFQALVNGIPDLLIRMNSDGIYLDIFPGSDLKLYDSKRSQVGANVYDILPLEQAQERMSYIQRALQTGESQVYEHQLTIEGEIHYEEVRIVPCIERTILVIVRDISERKNAEMALRQSEERLHLALNSTGDGIFDWNIKTGKVVHLQKQSQNINFVTNDYSEWNERIHPEDQSKVELALTAHFARITPQYKAEFRFLDRDGSYQWILARGQAQWDETNQPIRLVGIAENISDRKKIESQILAQKEFLRSIYEGVDQAIFVLDVLGNGEFRYVSFNPACERLTGLSTLKYKGKTPQQALSPETAKLVTEHYQTCVTAGECMSYEGCLSIEGKETWWITTLCPLQNEQGQIYRLVSSSTDITAQKQTEIALQERETMLRTMSNNLDKGIIYQLVREANGQYHFSYISAGIERIFGIKPEAVMADINVLSNLIVESDRQVYKKLKQESWQNLSVFSMQVRKRTPDGSIQWSQLRATPRRLEDGRTIWDGIEVDITELKETEKRLRESETKFHNAFEYAAIGVGLVGLDGRCLQVNRSMYEILGYTKEELLSLKFQDITHPDELEIDQDHVRRLLAGETNYYQIEKRYLHKLGYIVWILLSVSLV